MKDKYLFFLLILLLGNKIEAVNHTSNEQLLSMQIDIQETNSKINHLEGDLSLIFDRITEIEKNIDKIKKLEVNNKLLCSQKEKEILYQELSNLRTFVLDIQKNINNKLITAQQANNKLIEEISLIKKSLKAMLNYLELSENLILENEKKIYIVEAGETLSTISKKLKISITELKTLNKINNDKIYAGQKLILPSK